LATLRAFLDFFLAPVRHRFGLLGPKIINLLEGGARAAKKEAA
jgi:hypothetical protein